MLFTRAPFALALAVVGVAATMSAAGCYATQSLAPEDLGDLRRGARSREVVLRSGQRQQVRIGPASWVRFRCVDGATTSWVEAKDLRMTSTGVALGARPDASLILHWDEVQGVEVNDVDLGRTVVGVVAGTSLVIVAAAAEVTAIAVLSALTGGRVNGDLGLTRGAFEAVLEHVGERPENAPNALRPESRRGDEDDDDAALASASLVTAHPLFTSEARRRDIVRLGASVEMGMESGGGVLRPEATMTAGLRLLNVLEVGAGLSMLGGSLGATNVSAADLGTAAIPGVSGTWLIPRARVGLHLDLDPNRRVALALGQQVGVSAHGWVDLRTEFGVRLRIGDRFQLGLYPLNPRVSWNETSPTHNTTYVSAVELGWAM